MKPKPEKTYSIGVSKESYERITALARGSNQTLSFVADALLLAALDALEPKVLERINRMKQEKEAAEQMFRDALVADIRKKQ